MDVVALVQMQEKVFQKQLDWIRQADKKAQILMGTNLAMVAALLSLTSKPGAINAAHAALVLLGVFFPAMSLLACTAATSPRIKGRHEHTLLSIGPIQVLWRKRTTSKFPRAAKSLIYFGDIGQLTLADYADRVREQTPERYLQDLNMQCHVNATIANLKFEGIRRASTQLAVGFFTWALAIYLLRMT